MTVQNRYQSELVALSGKVGARNVSLVPLAYHGLRAGIDPDTLCNEIVAYSGYPPLTEAEVRRAINTAQRSHHNERGHTTVFSSASKRGFSPTKNRRPPTNSPKPPNLLESGFVRQLIASGGGKASSKDLKQCSPIPTDDPQIIAHFIHHIFKSGELVFVGTPRTPRTRENLLTTEELCEKLTNNPQLPTHFSPNPFTGEPGKNSEGKTSYCLDSTVAHRRMALIEFDALDLPIQAAFWLGAIRERMLPVRSLIYSGGKSIHGLIELKDDGTAKTWNEQWGTLTRILCSDRDPAYRADGACKNPSRLTRFPNAIRPETHRPQLLLWLA